MAENQKVEQNWETPSHDEIPVISRQHVQAMEQTDLEEVWVQAGMHHVLLRTIGRKSGNEHKVALPFWRDENGHPIVVASYAGAPKHPSWFVNLSDRTANPEVLCRFRDHAYWSTPDILDGEEYEKTWAALVADRAWYADYQARTDRRIPLVRLAQSRPA